MPRLTKDAPEGLKPYLFHNVELSYSEQSTEATGTCPFCGRDKLFVSVGEGLFDCKVCGERGNVYTFIRKLHEVSKERIDSLYAEVAADRGVSEATLARWGLVRSAIDDEWLLPGYGMKNGINNLYRWSLVKNKRRLLSTATLSHCLFGIQFWDAAKPLAYVCEGPWDGMAMEEALRSVRLNGGKYVRTGDAGMSLYASANVVAVPGCDSFKDDWAKPFEGKIVRLSYDGDHPRKHPKTGELLQPVGLKGMKSAAELLQSVAKEIEYVEWPSELPDGYDVRDQLNKDEEPDEELGRVTESV